MLLLFIFYYSSSPHLMQTVTQNKDKYNENTHVHVCIYTRARVHTHTLTRSHTHCLHSTRPELHGRKVCGRSPGLSVAAVSGPRWLQDSSHSCGVREGEEEGAALSPSSLFRRQSYRRKVLDQSNQLKMSQNKEDINPYQDLAASTQQAFWSGVSR